MEVPCICPMKGPSLPSPLPSATSAAGLAAGRDEAVGRPRSLRAVNSAWWQHELSRKGGCSLNRGLWTQCCRCVRTVESVCSNAPCPFSFLFWVLRDVPRAGGGPLPHGQGQARYSTDTLDPAPVGAGAPAPFPTTVPWLFLQALPPFVFLVCSVYTLEMKCILLLGGLRCACNPSASSHVPSVHLPVTP